MAHPPDSAETYPVCDVSKAYEVPVGTTSVTFISTLPLWAAGGLTEETTIASPNLTSIVRPDEVYIPANRVINIRFDAELIPWIAIVSHIPGTQGFVTAIWHNEHVEEEAVEKAIIFFDSQV